MKPFRHALIALALVAGGVLAGRAFTTAASPASPRSASQDGTPARPARPGQSHSTGGVLPAENRDLAALRNRLATDGGTLAELHEALRRVDIATLRTVALDNYQVLAAMTDGKDRQPHQTLYSAAVQELWRRQGVAALDWADGLGDPKERAMMTKSLLRRALEEDPTAARPWMDKYYAENGKSETNSDFLSIAMKGAAKRGVDEIVETFGMFQDSTLINPLYDARFPEDFDFAKLHAALGMKTDLSEAISHWALRDPDAAWEAVRKNLEAGGKGPKPRHYDPAREIGGLMVGIVASQGEAEGVKWTMERLATLNPEQRGNRLANHEVSGKLSPEGIAVIATHLPPAELPGYAADMVRSHGISPRSYAALDGLPRESLLRVLRESLSSSQSGPPPGSAAYPEYIGRLESSLRERYHLTEEEAGGLR